MDKEKLVKDLVNTFNDRDELHIAYKERMKGIFLDFFCCIVSSFPDEQKSVMAAQVVHFIDIYVEQRFMPKD